MLGGVGLGRATWRDQTVKYWRYIATPGKALPVLSKKTQNMFWHLSTFPLIWAFPPFEAAAVRSRSFQASQGNCMGSRNAYIPYFPTWSCVCYPTSLLGNAYITLLALDATMQRKCSRNAYPASGEHQPLPSQPSSSSSSTCGVDAKNCCIIFLDLCHSSCTLIIICH